MVLVARTAMQLWPNTKSGIQRRCRTQISIVLVDIRMNANIERICQSNKNFFKMA